MLNDDVAAIREDMSGCVGGTQGEYSLSEDRKNLCSSNIRRENKVYRKVRICFHLKHFCSNDSYTLFSHSLL